MVSNPNPIFMKTKESLAQSHFLFPILTHSPHFKVPPCPSEQLQRVVVEISPNEMGQPFKTLTCHQLSLMGFT